MINSDSLSAVRHVYRIKNWLVTFYLILGGLLLAFGLFMIFATSAAGESRAVPANLGMVLFCCIGVCLIALVVRSRLVIEGSRIEVRSVFGEKSAEAGELDGFRTISTRNGSFRRFYLKGGAGTFTVPNIFAEDDDLRTWMQRIPDLDKRDGDAVLAEIEQQQDLGATPQERLDTLKSSKTLSILLTVITAAAALVIFFGDNSLRFISAIVLALAPIVAAILILSSPLLYAVFKKKADPRAEIGYVLLAAGFGLPFNASRVHLVSVQPLMAVIVVVMVALCAAFLRSALAGNNPFGSALALIMFAGLYSYGLTVAADFMDDPSTPSTYTVQVLGKHVSHGRSTSYYLELDNWGPIDHRNSIQVNRSTYDQYQPMDQVCLSLHAGRLKAAWFTRVSCSAGGTDSGLQ